MVLNSLDLSWLDYLPLGHKKNYIFLYQNRNFHNPQRTFQHCYLIFDLHLILQNLVLLIEIIK
jgi:hypothetical protein